MNYAVIRHADGKKSKSKYQGGFKNGKNTSAYNHDYYIHNKEKWQDNQGDFDEEMTPEEKESIINERKQLGKKKKYSIIDRLMGQPEKDNLKRAQESYDRASGMKKQYDANYGALVQQRRLTIDQASAHNDLNTKRRTGEARAKNKLKEAQKAYDKTLSVKIEKGKSWLDKIFKDGRRK